MGTENRPANTRRQKLTARRSPRASVTLFLLAALTAVTPTLATIDVSADWIVCPRHVVPGGWSFNPEGRVGNRGTESTALRAWFVISQISGPIRGSACYVDSAVVPSLAPGAAASIKFGACQLNNEADYMARCSVAVLGDVNPANDTVSAIFEVSRIQG